MSVVMLKSDDKTTSWDDLLADIRARRGEFHEQGYISQDIIERFQAVGIYSAFVPKQFGGIETTPMDFLRQIELIAAADGSAGWVASFGFGTKYLSSLPASTLAEIYKDSPDVVFAGAVFPPQMTTKADCGVVVKGRWGFGSGCMGASLIGVGIKMEGEEKGGLPRMAVMPREKVTIEENWDTMGMYATGSHDLVVEDVLVPEEYTLIRGGEPTIDTPHYRYPTVTIAAQVLAVCGLGVAREAIDEIVALATRKNSITGAPMMSDRPNFQTSLAQMEAELGSARAWFYETTEKIWETVNSGKEVDRQDAIMARIASTNAAKAGANVARRAFEMSGTTGIFNTSPLSRYMADAAVVAQHAFLNDGTWQMGGAAMLDQPTMPAYP